MGTLVRPAGVAGAVRAPLAAAAAKPAAAKPVVAKPGSLIPTARPAAAKPLIPTAKPALVSLKRPLGKVGAAPEPAAKAPKVAGGVISRLLTSPAKAAGTPVAGKVPPMPGSLMQVGKPPGAKPTLIVRPPAPKVLGIRAKGA